MRMYAFYVVKGYELDKLANLKRLEKQFLYCAWEQYIEDENKKWGGE